MTDLEEFQEQLRMQNAVSNTDNTTTRVDPDGTIMEWDEKRKAWFPKIDDDFIARYQMSFGLPSEESNGNDNSCKSRPDNNNPATDWDQFNAQLAKLREEKGEHSEEVQNLTKAAHEALSSYYNSQAYRDWYEAYCNRQEQCATDISKPRMGAEHHVQSMKNRYDLRPSERVLQSMGIEGDDPDIALARAEAELQAGIPVPQETGPVVDESDQCQVQQDADCESTDVQKHQAKRKTTAPPPAWYEVDDEKNTHVYVTGLPPDITDSTFLELMSKYGVIMNEPFTNQPRIKLYRDENGQPKGDGRCCYVKVESVDLVMKILDGMVYSPGYTLHVERAKFQPKGQFDPKKRRRLTLKEKKKLKEQQENLFRWGIDTSKFVRAKRERVVILKNAFVEADFVRDVTLIPTVRDRLRAQCAKCGVVKKIVVHDTNPLGVVSVTFSTPEEADTALTFLDQVLFNYPGSGGVRQLRAERWDGKTNYSMKEAEHEEHARLHQWKDFLGGGSSSDDDEHTDMGTGQLNASDQGVIPDYWEAASPASSTSLQDTDEAEGGSSGNETT